MAAESMATLERPRFPDLPRTPSLTSSESSSGRTSSTDFEVHFKRIAAKLPMDGNKKHPPSALDQSTVLQETRRRSRTLSNLMMAARGPSAFVTCLKDSRVLSVCLSYIPWADFHILTRTCRDLRHLMRNPRLREVILGKYVPGFKYALENREMERFREVPVTLHHLELLSAFFYFIFCP